MPAKKRHSVQFGSELVEAVEQLFDTENADHLIVYFDPTGLGGDVTVYGVVGVRRFPGAVVTLVAATPQAVLISPAFSQIAIEADTGGESRVAVETIRSIA